MKIYNNYKGHDLIMCDKCKWQYDGFIDKNGSYYAQKHANQTGHTVSREIGRFINYKPKQKKI